MPNTPILVPKVSTQTLAKGLADVAVTLPLSAYTDVLSVSIPAGKITAGCFIRWKIIATIFSPSQGNWRPQIKLGTTAIHVGTGNYPTLTAASSGSWFIDLLIAFPTISSQRSAFNLDYTSSAGIAANIGVQSYETASEDFSGTKSIVLGALSTAATANNVITVVDHLMELIS